MSYNYRKDWGHQRVIDYLLDKNSLCPQGAFDLFIKGVRFFLNSSLYRNFPYISLILGILSATQIDSASELLFSSSTLRVGIQGVLLPQFFLLCLLSDIYSQPLNFQICIHDSKMSIYKPTSLLLMELFTGVCPICN